MKDTEIKKEETPSKSKGNPMTDEEYQEWARAFELLEDPIAEEKPKSKKKKKINKKWVQKIQK